MSSVWDVKSFFVIEANIDRLNPGWRKKYKSSELVLRKEWYGKESWTVRRTIEAFAWKHRT